MHVSFKIDVTSYIFSINFFNLNFNLFLFKRHFYKNHSISADSRVLSLLPIDVIILRLAWIFSLTGYLISIKKLFWGQIYYTCCKILLPLFPKFITLVDFITLEPKILSHLWVLLHLCSLLHLRPQQHHISHISLFSRLYPNVKSVEPGYYRVDLNRFDSHACRAI